WQWRQTCIPRLTAGWPAPVWPGPQGFFVAGASPPRGRGCGHRAQYVALICVPAWHPPGWGCVGSYGKSASTCPVFQPLFTGDLYLEPLVKEVPPDVLRPKPRLPERPLGPLERFDLSALKLVGIVWGELGRKALIKAPDGKSYFATL